MFQSTIVTNNFCMIPHSLIFSFILAHFGLKQNPTGLKEAIKRSDKNSKTALIIKSTLARTFLIKKTQKKLFLEYCTFHQIQPKYMESTIKIIFLCPTNLDVLNKDVQLIISKVVHLWTTLKMYFISQRQLSQYHSKVSQIQIICSHIVKYQLLQ